jgi:DNA-binding transcriptional LysR family regulator
VLNPWRLRLLCELETLGTIRAVAQSLHQSASGVSQQLAILEGEIGFPLLERSGRTLVLTPAGFLLARRAREILELMSTTEAEVRSLKGTPSGLVRVGAFPSASDSLVLPTVAALRTRLPEVTVEVEELEAHEGIRALVQGRVDLAITITEFVDAPLRQDVNLFPLATDPIVVVAPRGHRIEEHDRVDLAMLADEQWTFEHEGYYMSNLALHLCRAAGFEPRVVNRFNTYLITLRHVAAGGSITLLPGLSVDATHDVVARELDPPATRRIVAATRSSSAASAALHEVLMGLREHVAHLVDRTGRLKGAG